ncbi:pseudoazurin [Ancylobacter sp. 6x-1]|uniref:Pseudoazurin n=1 Tax=Ancylobacter crimeensis TaxID=2579147 RepID=A0ABT0D913_9HYPH|nr:pseudoazurin [Ancylobacter crimeensis]MCK0196399.1 pseudoazurin [Ancylobacter crimeensis]
MSRLFAISACFALAFTASAGAAEIEVKMLNQTPSGGRMVFEPNFIKANPGDTIHFVATDPSHNAESIEGMIPEGATPWKGEFSKDVTVTVDKAGVYGVRCMPHAGMGMVALIVVGTDWPNLDEAKKVKNPGGAKKRFDALFKQAEDMKAGAQ